MYLAGIDTVNGKAEFATGFVRGHGTRAILEAIHFAFYYAFEFLGLRKLVFHAIADNRQALALLARFGACPEGTFRAELVIPGGKYADVQRYALFRDTDWARLKALLMRVAPLALTRE